MEEAEYVRRTTNSFEGLLQPIDYYTKIREQKAMQAEEEKRRAKRRRIVWGVIAGIIACVIVYNLPFFKEIRAFHAIEDNPSIYAIHQYYSNYPDGRHYEDVKYLECKVASEPIKPVMDYLTEFPSGKYAIELNTVCDSLWDEVIQKYETHDKSNESPEAVAYMTAMLQHMKTYRINTIQMVINPSFSLKDYEEYDADVRKTLERISRENNKKLLLKQSNIVSLKENFLTEDEDMLRYIIADGVQKSFKRMFSDDFVFVVAEDMSVNEKSPRLLINYSVKNQELFSSDSGIPNIWTYTIDDVPTAYLLGIEVFFDMQFSIPDSDITYTYSEIGEPGSHIEGIKDIKDGYRQMTQICFAKFANKMIANLGLEEIYFRGE